MVTSACRHPRGDRFGVPADRLSAPRLRLDCGDGFSDTFPSWFLRALPTVVPRACPVARRSRSGRPSCGCAGAGAGADAAPGVRRRVSGAGAAAGSGVGFVVEHGVAYGALAGARRCRAVPGRAQVRGAPRGRGAPCVPAPTRVVGGRDGGCRVAGRPKRAGVRFARSGPLTGAACPSWPAVGGPSDIRCAVRHPLRLIDNAAVGERCRWARTVSVGPSAPRRRSACPGPLRVGRIMCRRGGRAGAGGPACLQVSSPRGDFPSNALPPRDRPLRGLPVRQPVPGDRQRAGVRRCADVRRCAVVRRCPGVRACVDVRR